MQLTRSIPAENLHRFYSLHLAPTLFGEWAVVMEWGRVGSPGTVREQFFQTAAVKTRRGYLRASCRAAA